jgi:hypothetical protein
MPQWHRGVVHKFRSKQCKTIAKTEKQPDRMHYSKPKKTSLSSGGRRCDVEVSGDAMKVIDISGLWRAPPADGWDWRASRWWEHGFVRRVELPEDADWRKVEAYFDDGEGSLEVKVPKNGDAHHATA